MALISAEREKGGAATPPELIYCSITGYDSAGPEAARPGYDLLLQGEAGLMAMNGEAQQPRLKFGVAAVDAGLVTTHARPEARSVKVLAPPYRFDGARLPVRSVPPGLGEGTKQVLQSLLSTRAE